MTAKELPQDLPTLETPRLILRKLRMEDAEDMFEYAQDRELGLQGLWLPYSLLQESIDDIAETIEGYAKGSLWDWAIEHRADRKMIGRLGLHHYHKIDNRADLGYALNRAYWGQGYGTEAAQAVIDFGFGVLNLHRIGASVLADNSGSIRVLTKIGMRFEGVKRDFTAIRGTHEDLHSFSILKPEWEAVQSPK
jgi:[ribosomal protein S5]-alanine N-acetyltransferase